MSMIAKKLEIENEDLLFMILDLYTYTSVVSCFGIKVMAKNMDLFLFCIYFGTLVLLNQKVIRLSYSIQASFTNKKDKYLFR